MGRKAKSKAQIKHQKLEAIEKILKLSPEDLLEHYKAACSAIYMGFKDLIKENATLREDERGVFLIDITLAFKFHIGLINKKELSHYNAVDYFNFVEEESFEEYINHDIHDETIIEIFKTYDLKKEVCLYFVAKDIEEINFKQIDMITVLDVDGKSFKESFKRGAVINFEWD